MFNPDTVWTILMFDEIYKAKMIEAIQALDGSMRVKLRSVSDPNITFEVPWAYLGTGHIEK